jgi:Fic family protein
LGTSRRHANQRTSAHDAEPLLDGFEGKLTTSKYAKLGKTSHDTALRDILSLVEHGILVRSPAGGRSTSYELALK